MNRRYVLSVIFALSVLASFSIYQYVYLPGGSCIQVLVSATNRITGKLETFGNPCIVPFWYTDVQDYNPTPIPVSKISSLGAPVVIVAYDNVVDLLLPSRECDRTYVVERSYDNVDWQVVGTTTFYKYQEPRDQNFRECEKDYVDANIASGTTKLFYRYGLLDEKGGTLERSEIGEVKMEEN
jgi:hypothetical protein